MNVLDVLFRDIKRMVVVCVLLSVSVLLVHAQSVSTKNRAGRWEQKTMPCKLLQGVAEREYSV